MTGPSSVSGGRMMAYLPGFYESSRVMALILDAQGSELDRLGEALDGTLAQFFVATATWGLRYWEETVGLPIAESDSDDVRRRRILAKLRGTAPFSASMLESIAEAYTQKPVDVAIDAASSTIVFTFRDAFLTDASFYAQIGNLVHAHLGTAFQALYTYPSGFELGFEYRRYLYGMPYAGALLCGTWPGTATLGYSAPTVLELEGRETDNQGIYATAGQSSAGDFYAGMRGSNEHYDRRP